MTKYNNRTGLDANGENLIIGIKTKAGEAL